ncbi:MAG: EAL domain-containing protein [Halofilum sp. (in: g-proteobacteria)]|nr:EAL domain-containing protein [Halofilum sp. (in: g-proteobacteria)]
MARDGKESTGPTYGHRRGRTAPFVGWTTVAVVALLALAVIGLHHASLTLMSGGRAYVHGEGQWSKGQQQAVYRLDRYAETGERHHLQLARQALDVPLGDRRARLALQGPGYDYAAAREGLLRGRNHPADIPTMIWMLEHFENAPYLATAIGIWESTDDYILELARIADQLERLHAQPPVDRERIAGLRERIAAIDRGLREYATRFSATIGAGLRMLRTVLGAIGAVAFGGAALAGLWLFHWATRRIAASEQKFWAGFAHAPVGVAMISGEGRFTEVNEAICRILGYRRAELVGAPLDALSPPGEHEPTERLLERAQAAGEDGLTLEQRCRRADGEEIQGKLTLTASSDQKDSSRRFIGVLQDVSEEHRLATELSYQANHDALTGQLNRRRIETELRELLERAQADGSRHVLGFVDLDQFKIVNDTCGHSAGDVLLRQVAHVMHDALRTSDVLARLGGDEFAFILRDCDIAAGQQVAEKLRADVAGFTFTWEQRNFPMSCSMGLVALDATVGNAGEALQMADTACYVAKERGRGRVQVYSDTDATTTQTRGQMEWISRLRDAIEHDRLELWAQRIERLDGTPELRYEILVRLRDTDGELYSPGAFLPAAERYDMAAAVDRWVLEHTCAALRAHPAHAEALGACHVNLSGQSLGNAELMATLEEMTARAPVPCTKLCLEITETAAIASLPEARGALERLRAQGCRVALDDFGRGVSSYGYLKSLPVDILKIDGTFVRDIADDELDRTMVRSIAQIGHVMGMAIIAEYVENEDIHEQVRAIGVDYAQGFGVGMPRPLDEFLAQPGTARRLSE